MSRHTPGPWYIKTVMYDNYPSHAVWAPFYTSTAVHWRKPRAGETIAERNQQNADARLISAAPELLNALEELVYLADKGMPIADDSEAINKARAAIAKATGQQ